MTQADLSNSTFDVYADETNFSQDGRFIGRLVCPHCSRNIPDIRGAAISPSSHGAFYSHRECLEKLGLEEGVHFYMFGNKPITQ